MTLDPRTILVHAVLRRRARQGPFPTVAEFVSARQQRPDPHSPPDGDIPSGVTVSEQHSGDALVYRVASHHGQSGKHFVYLHGGSYIGEISSGQWKLVMGLVKDSGSTCLVPIYPVAPRATATTIVDLAAQAIADAVDAYGGDNVSVLGDSAGGGIAVAAVQQMRDAGASMPHRMILLAPWLDATMSHPDQAAIEPHDLMMRRDYLLDAVRLYAGDLPLDDWRVSPLQGNFAHLPAMSVFTGAHDVVATDSRQLVDRVREVGGDIEYVEEPGMQHVYPVLPLLRQARTAKKRMARLLA